MKKFYYSCQATTHFLIFTDCIRYYYWLKDGIEALRDNRLYYVNMFQAVVWFFFGIFFLLCYEERSHWLPKMYHYSKSHIIKEPHV